MKMERRLDSGQKKIFQRVDEVLHYIWDPIGVSEIPVARDEYHSYTPQVFSLLLKGATAKDIA